MPPKSAVDDLSNARLSFDDGGGQVSCGRMTALVEGHEILFGHCGFRLLGTIADRVKRDAPDLATRWEAEYGRPWRNKEKAVIRLGEAFAATVKLANVSGLVLLDTMLLGSDLWRPGACVTDAVNHMRRIEPSFDASYARDDALCPPCDLLERARAGMPFAEYAQAYADHLRTGRRIELAAAIVVTASACGRLADFCCTDPYIPGDSDPKALADNTPYDQRPWCSEIPDEGCHRVILAAELVRFFRSHKIDVTLFEVDQTFGGSHVRSYH
jgi:hypothetical protein